jgi:uncharacterized repeat protein (TIGR01451 family)
MKIQNRYLLKLKDLAFLFLYLISIGLQHNSYSQSDPSLNLSKQDPTCSGDGAITALLENVENPGDLTYSLFLLPGGQLLATSETGVFGGLQKGNYSVKANFTSGAESREVSAEITLNEVNQTLSFTILSSNLCESSLGNIEVIVDEGTASIFELQGPSSRGPQESPIFENLEPGSYTVIVTDICGDRLSQSFEIQRDEFFIDQGFQQFEDSLNGCGEISVGHLVKSVGADISYPLQVNYLVYLPGGGTEEVDIEVVSGEPSANIVIGELPFFHDEAYRYDLTITDNCGQTAALEGNVIDRKLNISSDIFWGAGPCGKRRISIKPSNFLAPFTINFTDFPEGFDPAVFNAQYPGPFQEENIFFGSSDMPIPTGNYAFTIEDACGNTASIQDEFLGEVVRPVATIYKGCGPGSGSIQLNSFDFEFTKVEITKAPALFNGPLPTDVTKNVSSTDPRRFFMNDLPEGEYEFTSYTTCETTHINSVTIEGVTITENQIDILENCGSFNLNLNHQDNLNNRQNAKFGIQKFDPSTGNWVHPETGTTYNPGEELNDENSVLLTNGANNINLNYSGELRLAKTYPIWKNGEMMAFNESRNEFCLASLETFEIQAKSTFSNVNTFRCTGGSYEMSVNAEGYPPITYKIVEKDGLPFVIDNGNDPLFKGLDAGRYRLQLEDACGNLTNSTVQVRGENLPKIIPENLCEGENGALFIRNLDFLQFEWFKEGAPETILSTGPRLEFSPFNLATDNGTYFVKISDFNPESCVNRILEFTVDESGLNPEPGQGQEVSICKGEIVNLFDYLEGPFDNYGTWTELSNSNGELIENNWSSAEVNPGTYTFEYEITGICSGEKATTVTINLTEVPTAPQGNPVQEFCSPGNYTLADLEVEGTNIQWYASPQGEDLLPMETVLMDEVSYYAAQYNGTCFSDERLGVKAIIYSEILNNTISGDQALFQMETPEIIEGTLPQGGAGNPVFSWEAKTNSSEWQVIDGANAKDYSPPPLLETTSYRRTSIDAVCGNFISNEVTITVTVAPIIANNDFYGPLINYDPQVLPSILINDSLKNKDLVPEEINVSILDITDDEGNSIQLNYQLDEDGSLSLPVDIVPETYKIRYSICQKDVPENCDEATVTLEVIGISLDAEKNIDRTQALPGDIVNYTITLTNTSAFPLDNILLTENLPEELMILSATPELNPNNTWEIATLDPNVSADLELSVMPTKEGNYTNEINIVVKNFNQTIVSDELQVRPKMVDMTIQKSSASTEVSDGNTFEYQIIVSNNGPDPADNIRIVDFLPPQLRYLSARFTAEGLNSTPVFSQEGELLVWEVAEFPVGATLQIYLAVNAIRDGRIFNRAEVSADGRDVQPENNTSIETKTILPLFIPNVIKPDGDGRNETLVIRANHRFERLEIILFNRWGDIVYASTDYQNDWSAEGILAGTYYYQVTGIGPENDNQQYTGWVQVIKD